MEDDTIKREDYAPITQGLRERLAIAALGLSKTMVEGLLADCDNIDAIHKALEQKSAGMRDFCERVEQAAQAREDVTLWGTDYTALPLDADGEYIHIGDVMENLREDLEPKLHHRFKVYGIQYRDYGQVCALTEDGYPSTLYRANECRHYQAPTVEDVLREMADRCYADEDEPRDRDAIVAEYAAKLRLADDAE